MKQENADIIVAIPDRCYLSPDPRREFYYPFYFQVTYGVVPENLKLPDTKEEIGTKATAEEARAIEGPQIRVSGLEQLLPEEKIGNFIENLTKEGQYWDIRKAPSGSEVIMEYAGETPVSDFCFTASTERFLCEAQEKGTVVLKAQVKNFPGIEDYTQILKTTVAYIPWAKSLIFQPKIAAISEKVEVSYEYDGDFTEKRLKQDGIWVQTARSPYTTLIQRPSLFELEVFNDRGLTDMIQEQIDVLPPRILKFFSESRFFTEGQAVRLTWEVESASDVSLDGFVEGRDERTSTGAVVYPIAEGGEAVCYTLRVSGYKGRKPYTVSSQISLFETRWKNMGAVSGYFSGDIYANPTYQGRLFWHRDRLYGYAHPNLYGSADGLTWEKTAQNDACGSEFSCLAADYFGGVLYIMGRKREHLYFSSYDFSTEEFSCIPAGKDCNSNMGSFAFSQTRKAYCQIYENGISISCEEDGQWNGASSILKAEKGMRVQSGDYCFFKDRFYAVMLCSSQEGGGKKLYVYDCGEQAEEEVYIWEAGDEDSFVCLVPAENDLYILTNSVFAGYRKGKPVDRYIPPAPKGSRPWLGRGRESALMGIYPDKNKWNYS